MAHVLIIDDHLDQCRPVVRLLQISGHEAECVESGLQGLAWLHAANAQQRLPDVVICDAMMPDLDGSEVLRRIRQGLAGVDTTLPVVMYTAVAEAAYHDHLRSLGADDVWVKTRVDVQQVLGFVTRYDRTTAD